jgi:hypothetical protein
MKVQKNPGTGDARVSSKGEQAEEAHQNNRNHNLVQVRRLGESRRLVDGRWVAASRSTAMLEAMLSAIARAQTNTLKIKNTENKT